MDQCVISGVNFLTGILLARFLGIVEFGVFTIAWLVIEFLQSMQYSVIIAPMMSVAPKTGAEDRPAYFGAVTVYQLGFAALCCGVLMLGMMLVATFVTDWAYANLFWPLACAAVICQLQNFTRRYLFVIGRSGAVLFVDILRYGGQLALLVALFFAIQMDAAKTLWTVNGCAALATLVSLCFFGKMSWSAAVMRESLPRQWDFAKWMVGSEIMRWTTGNMYMFAAGAMLGAAAVGAIRAAQNLVGVCHILTHGLSNIVPVGAARRFGTDGYQSLINYLKRFTTFGALAIGTIVFTGAVAAEYWLDLIYGHEYAGFGYIVQWWAAVYFASFLTLPLTFGLQAMEQTKAIFYGQMMGGIVSVILVYPLISNLGVVGVMMGTLLTVATSLTVLLYNFVTVVRVQKAPA